MNVEKLLDFFRVHQDFDRDVHLLMHGSETAALAKGIVTSFGGVTLHIYGEDGAAAASLAESLKNEPELQNGVTVTAAAQEELARAASVGTLVFDENASRGELTALSALRPRMAVGFIKSIRSSYLPVWEAFRKVCERVYLRCVLETGKEEVLDWTPNDSGIELSVVFPVYNVAKYLEQCIDSVTAWKADYVEFLFVNDGSPDHSRDIILRRAQDDPRIRLIDKPNGGCASARQRGMDEARGRYIGFVDPDDFTDPDMFRLLLGRALPGGYEMCWCGYNEYYESTNSIKQVPDAIDGAYEWGTQDKAVVERLIIAQRVAIWRGIYLREMLDRTGIAFQTNLRRFDDLPFKVEVCAKARSAAAVKQHLYYYRLDRPGQDVACSDERLYVHFDIFNHLDKVFDRLDDRRLMDYLQVCKVQTHCYALSKIELKYAKEYARRAKEDFKRNAGAVRTLSCLARWMGGSGARGYLSVMTGRVEGYCRRVQAAKKREIEVQRS